ncbi:hypothetical protein R8Z50_06735 [Longispora sp. K20-0274]|uniref:hypothetical protein n=1 Tax=Longispora sp. K20-0274 TaxID=3088255 RepID=UPI00399A9794
MIRNWEGWLLLVVLTGFIANLIAFLLLGSLASIAKAQRTPAGQASHAAIDRAGRQFWRGAAWATVAMLVWIASLATGGRDVRFWAEVGPWLPAVAVLGFVFALVLDVRAIRRARAAAGSQAVGGPDRRTSDRPRGSYFDGLRKDDGS